MRAAAKPGVSAIPVVAQYLNSQDVATRIEVVKQLIVIGGKDIIDPLIRATRDADPEVQIRATDGLVNYYLPGYVKTGVGSSVLRAGASIKAKFSDTNDQVIDPWVIVRPDVITALGQLARGGASMDARANASRAIGILRGKAALPDLLSALRSKDSRVMYEVLIAMQKIRDPSVGPQITYLLRDLDGRVQIAAIETAGILRSTDAQRTLRDIISAPRDPKAERAALSALAMMPEPQDRPLFTSRLSSKDEKIRATALEGIGRLGNPADIPAIEASWNQEEKMAPRLAAAFAMVLEGKLDLSEDSPLRYLINTLNQIAWRDTAYAYLTEGARRQPVREALYAPLDQGTRDEKIYLSRVLGMSGDQSSIPPLEKLSRDTDNEVAQEGLRALRSLRARLGV